MNKLVTVTNKDIDALKNEEVILVYPLKGYCVGYEYYFDIEEIDGYILINRILTDRDIDKLIEVLKNNHAKGILFEDLGLIEVLKDIELEKILILDHALNNSLSINYYLDYVDSIVVSSDLSEIEIRDIVSKTKKKVVIYVFGLKSLMYSRRNLLNNYQEYYNLAKENILDTNINDKHFKVIESEYGTKIYAYPYYDALSLLDLDNVLYFWYDPILLNSNDTLKVLHNDLENIPRKGIFLDKKTIYKVGDDNA